MTDKLLNLDELLEKNYEDGVRFKDEFYPYAQKKAWSLLQRKRFQKNWETIAAIEGSDDFSEDDYARYNTLLHETVNIVAPTLPAEAHDIMDDSEMTQIIIDFLMKRMRPAMAQMEEMEAELKPLADKVKQTGDS